jgi:thermostable 8-oxoguanine DNA glycosylase
MITPNNITNYYRNQAELEEFLLFSILVAGKTAKTQAIKLDSFLNDSEGDTPFQKIINLILSDETLLAKDLEEKMKKHKLGQYSRLKAAFTGILSFKDKLDSVTLDELESVMGIGCKTSRFFILHSRPNQNLAVLDTHILKYMKAQGYNVPKTTPNKKKYKEIEDDFLYEAKILRKTPADLDLEIWKSYAK